MIRQPEEVRKSLQCFDTGWPLSPKQIGLAAHLLESVWPEDKTATQKRRTVLKWLSDRDSLKRLSASEVGAIIDWLLDAPGCYVLNQEAADALPVADGTDPAKDWGRFELNSPIEARNLQGVLYHYAARKPYRFKAYKEKLENGRCYLWIKKVPRD